MRSEPAVPPAPPCLLAFDTSIETMVIAACGPAGEVVWTGPGGAAASATLLPQAARLLDRAGLTWRALDAVAFGTGPGAFTGLRTACAVAQGLAFGLGCPVLPLDSLALVAEDTDWRDGVVWVAMDARMEEVYAAAYEWVPATTTALAGWRTLTAPALYTLPALADHWAALPPQYIAGTAIEAFGGRLPLGGAALQAQATQRAAALLRLARQAWARGDAIDPALALPTYVRDKVAQTSAERAGRNPVTTPAAQGKAIGLDTGAPAGVRT